MRLRTMDLQYEPTCQSALQVAETWELLARSLASHAIPTAGNTDENIGMLPRYANTSWKTRATRSITRSSIEWEVGRFMPVAQSSILLGQARAYLP